MGITKYRKKIVIGSTILLLSCGSLISVDAYSSPQHEMIALEDTNQYVMVEDSFDRSFLGGMVQRAKIRINQWFNGGTIYENTTLKSVNIDGYTLTVEEIKNNPAKLKELMSSRDENLGLNSLGVTNNTQDKYAYKDYLDLLVKEAQPTQIVSDTTWTKKKGPYYIAGEIQIMKGATLTIEAGTEVYFRDMPSAKYRSGFLVDGALVIEGTDSEKVTLKPYQEEGSWKGIYVTERGTLTADHVLIEGAGSWTDSAIYSYGPVDLNAVEVRETAGSAVTAFNDAVIENSLFENNENYGIDLYRYNKQYETVVRNNTIHNNKTAGRIIIRQTKVPEYEVTNNKATSNELNGFVLGGDIIGNMAFTSAGENVPYVLMNTAGVNGEIKPFTIYPKSVVDFNDIIVKVVATPKPAPDHKIVVNGTLNLNQSTITSLRDNSIAGNTNQIDQTKTSNRDWNGFIVNDSGVLNINNSTVKYAKEVISTHGKVNLNQAKIQNAFSGINGDGTFVIENSTFSDLEAPAFRYYAGNEALDISVKNSIFTNINDVLGKVQVYKSGGELNLVNLTANKVKNNGIELTGSFGINTTISQPGKNLPYLIPQLAINENVSVDVTGNTILKVEDGMLFGYKSGIDVYGELNLNGKATSRVTVTSLRDDRVGGDSNGDGTNSKPNAGDWGSINYHATSKNRDSQITYTDILYGGDHRQGYALGGEGKFNIQHSKITDSSEAGIGVLGTITIENSQLERNHGYGVYVRSNNNFSVMMNDNHFKDNLDYAAFVEFGSTLDHIEMSGNTASNNMINGVGITGTVRYDLGLLPAGTNFPYVIPKALVIEEGAKLTLNPKTVMKFEQNGQLDVFGNLVLDGDATNKIYFTSVKNDTVAGDTNNDGTQSVAQAGDWKSVNLYQNTKNNSSILTNYSVISYGGNQKNNYMLGGDGSLEIKNSQIAHSSSNGVSTFEKLTLTSSTVEENAKNGVLIAGNTLFDVVMDSNQFKNNQESAAYAKFVTASDKLSGKNNIATNNQINGLSIEGAIDEENTFVKLGQAFPYVVAKTFKIEPEYSLILESGVVIKYAPNAQFDVKGHLITNGTSSDKVYFTSLLDDSLAGDTNNDSKSTEAKDQDWKGIIYHAESEGTFNHFECDYSMLNMDYEKIPYLKAVAKGDDSVAISGRYAAYIELEGEFSSIKVYDFYTKEVKIVSRSTNKKINIMLDSTASGTNVAWIEEGVIKYSDINKINIKEAFSDSINVEYAYLKDNKIVFINSGNVYYSDLNAPKNLILNASTKFKPVINNKYLIYHNQSDDILYRKDIESGEEYYMMTTYNSFKSGDIFGDDIALLASFDGNSRNEIIIGDIPSWTAIQPTKGQVYYDNLALFKDKVTYSTRSTLNDRAKVYIAESSDNNRIYGDDSFFNTGYDVHQTDIGENSFVFTDNDLVYLLDVDFPTVNQTFVHGDEIQSTTFDRKLILGANFGISVGGSVEFWGVLEPGLEFSTSKEGTLSYTLHKDSLNAPHKISIGREVQNSLSMTESIDIGIGIKNIADVKFLGASHTVGVVQLRKDSHAFYTNQKDTYKNLGLLTGSGLIRFLNTPSAPSMGLLNGFKDLVTTILINKMENAILGESVLSYDESFGTGFNSGLDGYLGLNVEVENLGSIGGNIETGMQTSSMAIIGTEKTEEGKYHNYVQFNSSNTLDYPKIFFAAGVDALPDISPKFPKPLFYDSGSKNMVMETKIKSNGDVVISYTTGSQNKYGYNYTYTYTIENGVEYLKNKIGFEGLSSFNENLNSITEDEGLVLEDFKVENEGIAMGFLVGLLNTVSEGTKVDYEITLSKGNPWGLDYEFGESGDLMKKDGKLLDESQSYAVTGAEVSGAIGMGGMVDDEVSIVIDSGSVRNGKVVDSNLIIASIPTEDDSMISVLYNIVNGFGNQLLPKTVKYKNNQANYKNITVNLPENHDLRSATFLSTDVNIEEGSNGTLDIGNNQYLTGQYIYVESKDQNKKVISSYPSGSTITFDIQSGGNIKHAAIYQYDENNKDWIKLGGKIQDNGNGTGSIAIELKKNGQYALGYDTNQPNITFKHQGVEISSGSEVFLNDYINIEINDDLPLKNVTVKLNGEVIRENFDSSIFSHHVTGDSGHYELEITYQDRFGNRFKDSIVYVLKEKSTTLLDESEESITEEEIDNQPVEEITQDDTVDVIPGEEIQYEVDSKVDENLPSHEEVERE